MQNISHIVHQSNDLDMQWHTKGYSLFNNLTI